MFGPTNTQSRTHITQWFVLGLDAAAGRREPRSRSAAWFVFWDGQEGATQLPNRGSVSNRVDKYCIHISKAMFTCLRPRFRPNGGWIRRFCWPGSLCTLATLEQPIRWTDNTQRNASLRREQRDVFFLSQLSSANTLILPVIIHFAVILPIHTLHNKQGVYKMPSHSAEGRGAAMIHTLGHDRGQSRLE